MCLWIFSTVKNMPLLPLVYIINTEIIVLGHCWPLGGCRSLDPMNRCLFWTGRMTVSFNSVMTSSKPAMSFHVIYTQTQTHTCHVACFTCQTLQCCRGKTSPACWAGQLDELQYSSRILRVSHSSLRSASSTSPPGRQHEVVIERWHHPAVRMNDHQVLRSHLFLSFHLLLPGGVDGIHHPLDGEVGDRSKYGETKEKPDDLIPAQRTGDVLGRNLPQHHHEMSGSSGCRPEHQTEDHQIQSPTADVLILTQQWTEWCTMRLHLQKSKVYNVLDTVLIDDLMDCGRMCEGVGWPQTECGTECV